MKFTPMTQEEADRQSDPNSPWPAGDYDFEVRDAIETTSKVGNEMIRLEVWIYAKDGSRRLLFDYLVASASWKIKQFADACGMSRQYEAGALDVMEITGRPGRCSVAIQPAKDGFDAKNVIRAYLKPAGGAMPPQSQARRKVPADDLDDSIPF